MLNADHPDTKVTVVTTADHSVSLKSSRFGETYHSVHGAITESMVVFIGNGLLPLLQTNHALHIFELGFGSGLNALLTWSCQGDRCIYYECVEKYPPDEEVLQKFGQAQWANNSAELNFFQQLHAAPWNQESVLNENFTLLKHAAGLHDLKLRNQFFHLIYFDAFSMDVQAELWTVGVFTMMWNALQPGGVLVTYSARGAVKRALREAGFVVERLAGPPGKRHVLRAKRPC